VFPTFSQPGTEWKLYVEHVAVVASAREVLVITRLNTKKAPAPFTVKAYNYPKLPFINGFIERDD